MYNQVQPNAWSCLPTAFATATSIQVQEIIELIGHDGSEILFPALSEPKCRRAFHPQEVTKALLQWYQDKDEVCYFTHLSTRVICYIDEENHYTLEISVDEIWELMKQYDAVIIGEINGKHHSAAWDHKEVMCYDPCGFKYPAGKYEIHEIYLISRVRLDRS